jgi:hypothetical protein
LWSVLGAVGGWTRRKAGECRAPPEIAGRYFTPVNPPVALAPPAAPRGVVLPGDEHHSVPPADIPA